MGFRITGRIVTRETPLPPLQRQAENALRAAGRVLRAAATGQKIWLTPAKAAEHRQICESNQCGYFRASDARCSHPECGCFTRLKAKLATEKCPAGHF